MTYEITPYSAQEVKLFCRLDAEDAQQYGAICGLRIHLEPDGGDSIKRFDDLRHLKTPAFKAELDRVINYLRGGTTPPMLGSRQDLEAFLHVHGGKPLLGETIKPIIYGVKIQTEDYSYYLCCHPSIGVVNIYAYDNRFLLNDDEGGSTQWPANTNL